MFFVRAVEGAELPKAVAESHREFRGFRGSIQPYNPEKNEVSKKRFLCQALKAKED